MSRRKLKAIGYEKDFVDFEDDSTYRHFVCDIDRRYLNKREDDWRRQIVAKENTEDCQEQLRTYFTDCGFTPSNSRAVCADYLLNCVIEKMFDENEEARNLTAAGYRERMEPEKEEDSVDIKEVASKLCLTLGIAPHPDPAVSLEAACIYINKYLNEEFINRHNAEANEGVSKKLLELKSFPVGLPDFKDGIVNVAARILRLLNIEAMRDTQTAVNETLIAIQNIADSKSV